MALSPLRYAQPNCHCHVLAVHGLLGLEDDGDVHGGRLFCGWLKSKGELGCSVRSRNLGQFPHPPL